MITKVERSDGTDTTRINEMIVTIINVQPQPPCNFVSALIEKQDGTHVVSWLR